MSAVVIETPDGWRLAADYLPAREAVGVAVCAHAMMCNRRTLDRPEGAGLGSALAAAGYETYLVDLRGHGESATPPRPGAHVRYDDFVLEDLPAALRFAARAHPGLPVALVGHSLGAHAGLASLAVVPDLPAHALVSLGGNVWLRALEPDTVTWIQKRASIEAWGAITRLFGRFPARRLRYGTDDESEEYVGQFVENVRRNTWRSGDGRHDYLQAMRRVTLPILSVTGAADVDLCRPAWARAWLAHAKRAEVIHRVVGERPGDPTGINHMGLVTNPRMAPVWAEIAEWLGAAMPRGG